MQVAVYGAGRVRLPRRLQCYHLLPYRRLPV